VQHRALLTLPGNFGPGHRVRRAGWDELRLSAIASQDELVEVSKGRFYQRREGHALHPSRQSVEGLRRLQAENAYVFAAQQMQDPVPIAGNWVKPEWFGEYVNAPSSGTVVASIDSASKTNLTNDYSVIIIARIYQRRFYILDVIRKRMEFGELKATVIEKCRSNRVDRLLIEDAASGQQLIQMLRPPPHGVPFPIACKPEQSKEVRFHAQASRIEAGEVVLPQTAPWLPGFVKEVASFPGGRFDDQADALAQLLRFGGDLQLFEETAGPILVTEEGWRDEHGFHYEKWDQGSAIDPWGPDSHLD